MFFFPFNLVPLSARDGESFGGYASREQTLLQWGEQSHPAVLLLPVLFNEQHAPWHVLCQQTCSQAPFRTVQASDISHKGIMDEIPLFWVEGLAFGCWMLCYTPSALEIGSFD